LFENPGHGNHWVTLRLRGVSSNRDAMGARLALETTDGTNRRTIHATVSSGGSFGASSLQQEIGLGNATAILSLRVRWPNAKNGEQVFRDVPIDSVVEIVEGQSEVRIVPLESFRLGGIAHHH
jgi:hypothetical protein